MIVQLAIVVLGIVCATLCVITGHPEAGGVIGGVCGFLFLVSMM